MRRAASSSAHQTSSHSPQSPLKGSLRSKSLEGGKNLSRKWLD